MIQISKSTSQSYSNIPMKRLHLDVHFSNKERKQVNGRLWQWSDIKSLFLKLLYLPDKAYLLHVHVQSNTACNKQVLRLYM